MVLNETIKIYLSPLLEFISVLLPLFFCVEMKHKGEQLLNIAEALRLALSCGNKV